MVMAPAGHGKTTLCRELSKKLCSAYSEGGTIPLLVPFESVRRAVDFHSLMNKRLTDLSSGTMSSFAALLERGRAVLIVDGFDELADAAGFEVAESQVSSMRSLLKGKAKVVLAGRSLFVQGFAAERTISEKLQRLLGTIDTQVIEVLPFTPATVNEYIDTRIGLASQSRAEIVKYISHGDAASLASNPLFLRILCSLAASGNLPSKEKVTAGMDILLESVCKREEARQQLGIGFVKQDEILRELAKELFLSGQPFSVEDTRIIFGMYLDNPDDALLGKLSSHALLSSSVHGKVEFIHPLIRDVLLGHYVAVSVQSKKYELLQRRDLPVGTLNYLGSRENLPEMLPPAWLGKGLGKVVSLTKRNLFRAVREWAKNFQSSSPRQVIRREWLENGAISGLDLSGLPLESISFDNIDFIDCSFLSSYIKDCDFRHASFRGGVLHGATFDFCRFENVRISGNCRVGNVWLVLSDKKIAFAESVEEFSREISALSNADESFAAAPPADVQKRIYELFADLFRCLVDVGDGAKFYTVLEKAFVAGVTDREKTAVAKVLAPGVQTKICNMTLHAGSQSKYTVDKLYQGAVAEFLSSGFVSEALREVLSPLAARAARYFS